MNYVLTGNSRVDFTAYAPMHTFRGWAAQGLQGKMEINFDTLVLKHVQVMLDTRHLDTGDSAKNRAMVDFFHLDKNSEAGFVMTEYREFYRQANGGYRITVLGILDFAGIRRQLPITCMVAKKEDKIIMHLQFKWSFKAYGLKAPRLLFMTVRDIVDIKAGLVFIQDNTSEE